MRPAPSAHRPMATCCQGLGKNRAICDVDHICEGEGARSAAARAPSRRLSRTCASNSPQTPVPSAPLRSKATRHSTRGRVHGRLHAELKAGIARIRLIATKNAPLRNLQGIYRGCSGNAFRKFLFASDRMRKRCRDSMTRRFRYAPVSIDRPGCRIRFVAALLDKSPASERPAWM